MSGRVEPSPTRAAGIWPMYRAMVGVGLACGLLIVLVFDWTRPIIDRAKAEALQRAIFQVVPGSASSRPYAFEDGTGFVPLEGKDDGRPVVHAAFGVNGALAGVAVEAEGMGYQDVIRLIYGYSIEQEAIVGVHVLESKETPGLGDRIETDPEFLANFDRLDVRLGAQGDALANPVVAVKHGQKEHPWEVDGITGATISSVAIANILDRSAAYWVPKIRRQAGRFEAAKQEGP